MSRFNKSASKNRISAFDKERCIILGEYIYETKGTVRDAAKRYGISKSTVHKDVTQKLEAADRQLYEKVHGVLERNKAERHLRGGEATKKKYKLMRK